MGLFDPANDTFHVNPAYQAMLRAVGLDARGVFGDERIRAWRVLPDRENCTLDALGTDDQAVRLHIKRYRAVRGPTPAEVEQAGHRLLADAKVATAPLAAWGRLTDGRSFTVWPDLRAHLPGDKFVTSAETFDACLDETATLAARLHAAGLHHRDLYLCHFMIGPGGGDVQLIDTARVKRLPGWPLRSRWIIKDLGQFWYSTTRLPIEPSQRERWLARYAEARGVGLRWLRAAIRRKSDRIARHDARLNRREPRRNISIAH